MQFIQQSKFVIAAGALIFLLVRPALATPGGAAAVVQAVRIESGSCAPRVDPSLVGSGALVGLAGRVFAIASFNAVVPVDSPLGAPLSGSRDTCHFAVVGDRRVPARWRASRWDLGLALLELEASSLALAPTVFGAGAPPSHLRMSGWLAQKKSWLDVVVQTFAVDSARHFFAQIKTVYEIKTPFAVEASAAGSGLWSEDGTLWAVLSNQYIEPLSGAAPRILRASLVRGAPFVAYALAIAIPINAVEPWIREVVGAAAAPSGQAGIGRVRAADVLAGRERVQLAGLSLEAACPDSGHGASNRAASGSPAGGSEYPIGGADGYGIGGDEAGNAACRIDLELAPGEGGDTPLPERAQFFATLRRQLQTGAGLSLWYAYEQSPLAPFRLRDVGDFAQQLRLDTRKFVYDDRLEGAVEPPPTAQIGLRASATRLLLAIAKSTPFTLRGQSAFFARLLRSPAFLDANLDNMRSFLQSSRVDLSMGVEVSLRIEQVFFAYQKALPLKTALLYENPEPALVGFASLDRTQSKQLAGSALLYKSSGADGGEKIFALTSEHVGFHANSDFRHWIRALNTDPSAAAGQDQLEVDYVNSDWSNGLALYRIPDPARLPRSLQARIRPLSCAVKKPLRGDSVRTGGFPAGAQSIVWSDRGQIEKVSDDPGLLASVRDMLRISGSLAEFGMSGGPVYSKDQEWLGVLSHKKSLTEDIVWAIPCATAKEWTKSAEDPNFLPSFFRYGGADEFVISGPLYIRFEQKLARLTIMATRSTTGGDKSRTPAEPRFAAIVDFCARWFAQRSLYFPGASITGFTRDLMQNPVSSGQSWIREPPQSLVDGIRRLLTPEDRPFLLLDRQGEDLEADASRFLVEVTAHDIFPWGSAAGERYFAIVWILRMAQAGWQNDPTYTLGFLKLADIDELLNGPRFADAWVKALADYPEATAATRQALEKLRRDLRDYII